MRGLRIIVAIQVVVLAVVVGLVLHSERHQRFSPSLAVARPAPASPVIPVFVELGLAGSTRTAALVARGGRAQGVGAFRRLTGQRHA
jgi:hypothetical protein